MALFDQRGNQISSNNPSLPEISKSINRDMSRYGEWSFTVSPASMGRLSWKVLRNIYELSSSVRPAVDSIAREVSHLPWRVIHKDLKYHPPSESEDVRKFLKRPNSDHETLSTILAKFITDLLVTGKGTIEKARTAGTGKIAELIARDSSVYLPQMDRFGQILHYNEYKKDDYQTIVDTHAKEDLIYKLFTPVTYTLSSIPIIETIINEVALLMLSVKAIGWAFVHDEIPPGILHLGAIGEAALERAKASFEATKGILNQGKIRVVDNVDKVDWVELQRPFREMQVAELMPIIERIVARNFGLSPVESSLTDVNKGAADIGVKSSQSKLILPLLDVIDESINLEVVDEINPDVIYSVHKLPQESFQERAAGYGLMWRSGIVTRNEARLNLGMESVEGGDIATVLLGNEVVPLDPVTGLPLYRNPPNTTPPSSKRPSIAPSEDEQSMLTPNDFRQIFNLDEETDLEKTFQSIEDRILSKKKSSL